MSSDEGVVENEKLGYNEADVPDYLQISFCSTDYIGHLYGPSSLETEDNLLRLDRTLADLFRFTDEKVGSDHTLIVLSGDRHRLSRCQTAIGIGGKRADRGSALMDTCKAETFSSTREEGGRRFLPCCSG
jgi:hypothetical protein